jgi:tetratricopeptide (TPR) repeat protein
MQGFRNNIRNRGFSTLRKKRPPLVLFLIIGLVVAGVAAVFIAQYIAAEFNNPLQIGPAETDVTTLWEEGNYAEIIDYASAELAVNPLNQSALTIGGFAHFHLGYNQVNLDTKLIHIDQAIALLRRSLIQNDPYLRTEVYYILGKSYYHKGKYFADLSIKFLEMAKEEGFEAVDLYEYLGLAYSSLGFTNSL